MRLIGLALIAMLFIGTALSLSMDGFFERSMQKISYFIRKPSLIFEPTPTVNEGDTGIAQARIQHEFTGAPVILSGLPSYGSVRYNMPLTARPVSGYLDLKLTLQSLQGVEGVLRVSIDNTRRAEVLLEPTRGNRILRVGLTQKELSQDRLNVSFSLVGTSSVTTCSEQDNLAVVAEVEANSALVLQLDAPITTPQDRIIAWGNNLHVDWSKELSEIERNTHLALAAGLIRKGAPVSFRTTDALGSAEMHALLEDQHTDWNRIDDTLILPMQLVQQTSNAGVRDFTRRTIWRSRYALDEVNGGELPNRFELGLNLGPLPLGAAWTVSSKLNGHLLAAEILKPGTRDYAVSLELPTEFQVANNSIEVTAASTLNLPGECNDGPDLIAEMTSATALYGSGAVRVGRLQALHSVLRMQDSVEIAASPEFTPADATAMARMIAAAVPDTVAIQQVKKIVDVGARITPLRRIDFGDLDLADEMAVRSWIVYLDDETQVLQLIRASSPALTDLFPAAPLALLVTLPVREVVLLK